MQSNIGEKIARDAIQGPRSMKELSAVEAYMLLKIYNKKFAELTSLYGSRFEHYTEDNQEFFDKLANYFGIGDWVSHALKQTQIVSHTSSFLFTNELVTPKEISALKTLIDYGYLNILDIHRVTDHIEVLHQDEIIDVNFMRSDLSNFIVLINTPNTLNVQASPWDHFFEKTPQFSRFEQFAQLAKYNPKTLTQMNQVYAFLILIDEVSDLFKSKIKSIMNTGSTHDERWISSWLYSINKEKEMGALTEEQKLKYLSWTDLNMVIGWIFDCRNFDKKSRFEFIESILSFNGRLESMAPCFSRCK